MKVLVIGGTRFIGPPVVRRLVEAGHEITVFHRGHTVANLPDGVRRIKGDRGELEDYAGELRGLAPEVVVDMVPMNEQHARSVMSVFREISRRIVAISSGDVYRAYDIVRGLHPGPPDPTPLTEDSLLRESLYPYEREGVEEYEKILVERVVLESEDISGTVLRLPMVYGPNDYMHRMYPYLKRMEDGRQAILLEEGMASWRWTMGYVEDVAAAIAHATTDERAAGRVYNIGKPGASTHAGWVREIGRAAGWNGEVVAVPRAQLPKHLDWGLENTEQHLTVDTSRIRRELGYVESISREEAIQRTVEWESVNPPSGIYPAESFDYAAEDAALVSLN
jgi:nucleoside-diphosphate-sugar epimerase